MALPCYIFDIDGTLADCSHRLPHIVRTDGKPKDWDAFFAGMRDDPPIKAIVTLARACIRGGWILPIYVTGRGDEHRAVTEQWLLANRLSGPLYMRKVGDRRDDHIVKAELLAELKADGWEPMIAFEDRKRVVDMWRAHGIICAHVAEGNF